MHCHGFEEPGAKLDDQFVFRQGRSRETSYARDYDKLFELLKYEKENGGNVVWVMGPAFAFDADARAAMQALIENGYAQGVLAAMHLQHMIWKGHFCIQRWDRTFIRRSHSQMDIIIIWMC